MTYRPPPRPSPRAIRAADDAQRPDAASDLLDLGASEDQPQQRPLAPLPETPPSELRMRAAIAAAIRAEGAGHGREAECALVFMLLRLARVSGDAVGSVARVRGMLDLGAAVFAGDHPQRPGRGA